MLLYRLPGHEIQRFQGRFERIHHEDPFHGFVVSSSDGKQRFTFKVDKPMEEPIPSIILPEVAEEKAFIDAVQKLKIAIQHAGLIKVVLSRIVRETLGNTSIETLFQRMCTEYPNALVYCFVDRQLGTWIGASPEVLLRRIDRHYFLMSLAGTKRTDETREWTEKETHEQRLVTDFLLNAIEPHTIEHQEIQGPYPHPAGPVTHLRTDITFTADAAIEKALIDTLHPTPAVCGLPREMASEAIAILESHNRELYSGFIGLFEKEQTHCYVNLRCAKVVENDLYAFVGAGITSDSNEQDEWRETENKSRTLLDLL
jgi:isochorismate synthase